MHRTTNRFRKTFEALPNSVKKVAKKNFELLITNPFHPSLHFKKVGKFWSVRVGINYRALSVEDGEDFIWVWIGTHNKYEQMIKDKG